MNVSRRDRPFLWRVTNEIRGSQGAFSFRGISNFAKLEFAGITFLPQIYGDYIRGDYIRGDPFTFTYLGILLDKDFAGTLG